MKTRRCYIYTRVSTSMQVDGYSLDAQKDKLKKYAEFQDMVVAGEYSDEGKSGKNIEGRPQFLQMLKDIESGKDKVEFVLVFKLSRFGRNAADVLSSLQRMQDFGVNLICVEDGIDSSKDSGKLMISVLSAVAEIERENILVQTMEGRRQKAREGKWNGGFAPYGYKLVDGYLYIADDEVDVIRIIFDKYVNTTMGASAVATYLNEHGYVKKKRQNNTLDMFSAHFIKSILDNPVYCGKLAYGRRKNEKIAGTRNQYHIVKQDDYPVYDGVHEAIVSEEVWQMAQRKRQETGVKSEKIYNQEHENILSSILRCPVCGAAMYGNVNRKKKKDGTLYKDYYYYHCKHRTTVNGHKCGYRRQWKQEMVDAAVEEVIRKLVTNPKFEQAIRQKIGSRIDTEELETELEQLRKKLHQLNGAKAKLGQQMDSLDVTDKHYDRKYQDMEERLYKLYDDIDSVEEEIEEVETRIYNVRQQKISGDNIYQFLLYFDKLYDKFTDAEKKEFLNSFIERVDIYEQEQPDGRFLKHIKFRFPVYFNGKEIEEMSWDNETTVETFQYKDYADRYSDAYELYGYDAEALFNHYETVGKAENRVGRFKKTAEEDDRHPYVWDADEPLDPLPPLDFHAQPDWFDARTLPENLSNVRIIKEYEQLEAFIEKDEWIGDPVLVRKEELLTEMSSRVRNYDGRRGGADYLRAISQDIDVLLDFMG